MAPKTFLLVIAIALSLSHSISSQIDFNKNLNWEEVQALAELEEKIIFLDAYTEWCFPCKMMDKNVFTRYEVGQHFNKHFINYKMDMEKMPGPILALNYGVNTYPNYLFLSSEGTLIYKVVGVQKAEDIIAFSKTAMDPLRLNKAKDERYAAGDRKADFLHNYCFDKFEEFDPHYKQLVIDYLDTQKDWSTTKNLNFIYNFLESYDSPLFDYLVKNKALFYEKFEQTEVDRNISFLVQNKISNANPKLTLESIKALYIHSYGITGEHKFSEYQLSLYDRFEQFDEYAGVLVNHMKDFPPSIPDVYFDNAKFILENTSTKAFLIEALQWNATSLDLNQNERNYLQQINILIKMKDKKKAKNACKAALKWAKKSNKNTLALENQYAIIKRM